MRSPRPSTLALVAALALPASAAAELVVLAEGGFLKVDAYRVEGDRVDLELVSGGRLTMSLGRVERIVDDEIVPAAEIVETPAPDADRRGREAALLSFRDGAPVPETPYGELIWETAKRHEVDPELVAAMVRYESAFDPEAVSVKGARGLMQLMPATADRFGIAEESLFEPERNLEAGVRYLKWLDRRYNGDLERILAAYNAGEANVDRYDGVPPFRETQDYVRRVYRRLGLEAGT